MPHRAFVRVVSPALCLLVVAGIGAQRGAVPDPLVRENATVKLADHTYVIPDGNVGLVPNVGIVVGSKATLVIDPGLGRRNGETVLREVAKVSRNTDMYVATTHFHLEHSSGVAAFPSAKYVSSTTQEFELLTGFSQQSQAFSGRSQLTAELLEGATARKADIAFSRNYSLDLGGVLVRFMVVGPTHTRGDMGIVVDEDAVLFSGDVVMNNSFLSANQGSSMNAWLSALDAFQAMRPRTIVPSHGAVGDGSIIATNRDVMQTVQARSRALKEQGMSLNDTGLLVQKELLAKYPGWPRANGLIAASGAAYREAP